MGADFKNRLKTLAQSFEAPDIFKRLDPNFDIEQELGVRIHDWSELRSRSEYELFYGYGHTSALPHSTFIPTGTLLAGGPSTSGGGGITDRPGTAGGSGANGNGTSEERIAFSLRPSALRPTAKIIKNSKANKSGGGRTYTSKFRGVHQTFPTRRWEAQFRRNGKPTSLGCFDHEEEAAKAYDKMMIWCELHNAAGVKGGITNFDPTEYEKDIMWLQKVTQDELVAILRSDGRRQAAERMMKQKRGEGGHDRRGGGSGGGARETYQQQQQQQQQQQYAQVPAGGLINVPHAGDSAAGGGGTSGHTSS